jgi:hypothetical protein
MMSCCGSSASRGHGDTVELPILPIVTLTASGLPLYCRVFRGTRDDDFLRVLDLVLLLRVRLRRGAIISV